MTKVASRALPNGVAILTRGAPGSAEAKNIAKLLGKFYMLGFCVRDFAVAQH